MAIIQIPSLLRQHTHNQEQLFLPGDSIAAVTTNLVSKHPPLAPYVLDSSGELCSFISLYLNDKDVRSLNGKATPVQENDKLTFVLALAGG